MSLYRAYFVPGAVDPLGLKIRKCKCYYRNDHRVPAWDVFTTGSCQDACCADESPKSLKGCRGYELPPTPDETDVIGLCSAVPKGVDSNGDGVSDYDECQNSIANLMTIVRTTETSDGTEGEYCFQFISAVQENCGCKKGKSTVQLPGSCTIRFRTVFPIKSLCSPSGVIFPTDIFVTGTNWWGYPTNGYSSHGIAEVCCGPAGKKKCMYFDIGSENPNGQFGGDDRWFSPNNFQFRCQIEKGSTPLEY